VIAVRSEADADGAAVDFHARAVEDFARQGELDLFKQLAFLAPYVCGKEREEGEEEFGGRGLAEFTDHRFHRAVFGDQLGDDRQRPAGREQDLLFDFEMVGDLDVEAIDHLLCDLGESLGRRVRGERASRHDAEGESMLVLMREGDQGGVAKHYNYFSCRELD
jgi:hypothetical protein